LSLQLNRRCERTVKGFCPNLRESGRTKLSFRDGVVSVSSDD
jgi:hypothetical protein